MRTNVWLTALLGLGLAACSAAPTVNAPLTAMAAAAQTRLWRQVIGTATALRLTASAPASPPPATLPATPAGPTPEAGELETAFPQRPVTIHLSAQLINAADYVVTDPVLVSVEAPGAVSVIFFVTPAGTGMAPSPQAVDTEAADGWTWTWSPPASGWLGHVWAEAHYSDGAVVPSATLLTISPDGLGTPAITPDGASAPLPPSPATAIPPAAPAGAATGVQIRADCTSFTRGAGWGRDSPPLTSPDGRWVAQSFNAAGAVTSAPASLRVAPAAGAGEVWVPMPNTAEPMADPLWSPDSQWLIFTQVFLSQPGGGEIWKVRPDGSDLTWLARYTGYHDQLAWSPDGRYVAFTDGRVVGRGSGTQVVDYAVWLALTDGSGQRFWVGAGCDPDWGPGR